MNTIDGLYYSEDHEWVKIDGELAYLGITDYASHSLGSIVFVELPAVDTVLSANDSFGVVESVKAASDLYTPISGTVTKVNDVLVDDPALLNEDPYENWIACIKYSDKAELDSLMNADAYKNFTAKE